MNSSFCACLCVCVCWLMGALTLAAMHGTLNSMLVNMCMLCGPARPVSVDTVEYVDVVGAGAAVRRLASRSRGVHLAGRPCCGWTNSEQGKLNEKAERANQPASHTASQPTHSTDTAN